MSNQYPAPCGMHGVIRCRTCSTIPVSLAEPMETNVAATVTITVPPTPSYGPCEKCGHTDISVRWCDGCTKRLGGNPLCRHGDPEHLHLYCRGCTYEWKVETLNEDKYQCEDNR